MQKILLINPNTSYETMAMMHRILNEALPASIEVLSVSAGRGASMLTTESDLRVAADEVCRIGQARAGEVSAIVIGAFGDPGLDALQRAVAVPVCQHPDECAPHRLLRIALWRRTLASLERWDYHQYKGLHLSAAR